MPRYNLRVKCAMNTWRMHAANGVLAQASAMSCRCFPSSSCAAKRLASISSVQGIPAEEQPFMCIIKKPGGLPLGAKRVNGVKILTCYPRGDL